jgi:deoxycytidine triphosphate deaminase
MSQNLLNAPVGILAKQDLEAAIDQANLISNANKSNLQACSYDMRVGTIFKNGQILNDIHTDANKQFSIEPGEIISIFTLEELNLPANVMATAFAMNGQSSRSLLVLNPGHVDPGFKGCLTVKAINFRKVPLTISRNMSIFTVIFEVLPHGTTSPYTKNVTREQQERDFNASVVEQATNNISEIIIQGKDSPYVTRQEAKEIVQNHWMTWLTLILTFVAALTGIIAIVLTVVYNTHQNQNVSPEKKSTNNSNIYS